MKQILIWFVALAAITIQAKAQEQEKKNEEGFQFTVVKENPITPVKNQSSTGTCLLYTSDAADDLLCVDLGGRRILKKTHHTNTHQQTHTNDIA